MADPYKDNVVLYLPMEGTHHGDTVILDKTGKTITRNGDTFLSTAVAPPFGTTSTYFDGTGDYLSIASSSDFDFGTNNFTLEFWCYQVSSKNAQVIDMRPLSTQGYYLAWSVGSDQSHTYHINGSNRITGSAGSMPLNTWNHVAICRNAQATRIFINGVQSGSTWTDSNSFLQGIVLLGSNSFDLYSYTFNGYIKNFRITKGVARYTDNFYVDRKPFPWDEPEQPRIML